MVRLSFPRYLHSFLFIGKEFMTLLMSRFWLYGTIFDSFALAMSLDTNMFAVHETSDFLQGQ